ncbi:F-box/kelch-repeat protein At3g23880-like [Papaver somniferum]|uniref:F-box/kelch-repeat protein At3g23880-like n=1 Tax=Papaver somniferum TaxID=3469 RepID=UPI000E7049A5|nr:F-box/kelch-repeat protein At3g23880-like [Papaver somniferum]
MSEKDQEKGKAKETSPAADPEVTPIHVVDDYEVHKATNNSSSKELAGSITCEDLERFMEDRGKGNAPSVHHFDENSSESDSLGHEIMDFCCPVDCSLVGSCNGLICLHGLTDHITPDNYDEASRIVYVRNPITKKYVTLPKLPSGDEPVYFFVIGFGYVPTTNEYKVVRMQWRNEGNIEIEIGMGAWQDGVFANGCIYWNLGEGEIVAFDLADEMFVELPECSEFREIIDDGWNRCIRLGVLGDCLCATHYNTDTETSDVWFLEKKQDESLMSWSMGFSLDANTDGNDIQYSTPLALTSSATVLCRSPTELHLYDLNSSSSKNLAYNNESFYDVIPHSNSLVFIDSIVG